MHATIVCEIRDQGYAIGLGLISAKTVVEGHFGSLSFNGNVGEATTFIVTLPTLIA